MKILIDTHILIWVIENNSRLSVKHTSTISDTKNEKFVSEFSFIELSIKLNIGKLPDFKTSLTEFMNQVQLDGFKLLPVYNKHLEEFVKLSFVKDHRDPFDRLLIATAIAEGMSIVTKDEKFKYYSGLVNII